MPPTLIASRHHTDPLRGAAHGLWLGPATTAAAWTVGVVAAAVPDHGNDLSGIAALLWFGGIALIVGLPVSMLCGGAVGLVSGWMATLLRDTRAPSWLRAVTGGVAAAAVVGVPLSAISAWALSAVVLPVCLAAGTAAAHLAARPRTIGGDAARPPRRAGGWLAAGVATGLAAWTALLWRWFDTGFILDPGEWCANKLGAAEVRTVFAGAHGFPPTSWCIADGRAVQAGTPWLAAVVAGLLAATALCVLVWLVLRRGAAHGAGARWSFRAALVTLAALGAWWVVDTYHAEPPATALALAAERAAQADAQDTAAAEQPVPLPATTPAPAPPVSPEPVSLDLARLELDALQAQAMDAGGPDLLWQQPMAVTEAPCTDAFGRTGTALDLYGRFTTRDLDTAADNVDFLFITQDNERTAKAIVTTWNGGSIDGVDITHGEYLLIPVATTLVERADVGFDRGVGELHVTSACAIP